MGLVRLASRAVIAVFDRASDVENAARDLQRLGIRAVDVSVLGTAVAVPSIAVQERGRGLLGALGKKDNWLPPPRLLDVAGIGRLTGVGPLAEILERSPSTSPTGALVMQGIPQRDALLYEGLLRDGKVIVLIGVADRTVGERVRDALEHHGAQSVSYYAGRPYGTAFHGVGPGLR